MNRAIYFLLLLAFSIAFALPAKAQSIIRDTEIENLFKEWATPVIKGAELSPEAINIILVNDKAMNAFVAGGPNIFIYTGLINETESAGEIVGVIAHELGHIRGGHLVRLRGALQNASYESLLGTILGLGAAVLTGEGGLASAIALGTQSAATGRFLSFSRVQESSADQAALTYIDRAKMSPDGLVSFMKKLENQELIPASQQSKYVRTHPLTADRVEALNAGKQRSAYKDATYPPEWEEQHERILAKLTGFLTPERVEWEYDSRDTSIKADYARAIAAYRQNQVDKSLELTDSLLRREPNNPYFLELKGQMLMDYGRVSEAVPYYKKSIELAPHSGLIRTAYAHALIESAGQDNGQLKNAITQLQRAMKDEPRSIRIQRLLATAYGRIGEPDMAKLYLAEEALLKGEIPYAKQQAKIAQAGLKPGTQPWIRANDILNHIDQVEKAN